MDRRLKHLERRVPDIGVKFPVIRLPGLGTICDSPKACERYLKRYTIVVSVSAGSGVGSP